MTQLYTVSRVSARAMLDRLGIANKLPAFGRVLIVNGFNGQVLRIEKAYDTGACKHSDTFVVTARKE